MTIPQIRNLKELGDILETSLKKGLEKIDADNLALGNKTNLATLYNTARQNFTRVNDIYKNGVLGDIRKGNFKDLEAKLFDRDVSSDFINDVFRGYKFTKNEKELLQGLLERKYKNEVLGRGPVGPIKEGQTIPLAGERSVRPLPSAENAHRIFLDENKAWINKLFPDDPELSKFGDIISTVAKQATEGKRLRLAEKKLRNTPWFKKVFEVDESAETIIRQEPQKLVDEMLNADFPTKALKDVEAVLRVLPANEAKIAREQLRALALRRVLNPLDKEAAAKGGTINIRQGVQEGVELLNKEIKFFNHLYGLQGTQNLRKLLKEAEGVIEPGRRAVSKPFLGFIPKPDVPPGVGIPLIFAKVWVGVLNRKARAFNLGRKYMASKGEQKVADAVYDAEVLAQLMRTRKPAKSRLVLEKTFFNILGLSGSETRDLDALINELPEGSQFPEIGIYEQMAE